MTINDTSAEPPDHYRVQFAHEGFNFVAKTIQDPVPTGEQLLAVAGLKPAREHLLFQLLPSGALEEIRPDETVDLREPGHERFVSFKSDRTFRFHIDDESRDWGQQKISGLHLKQIAQVDPLSHDVFRIVVGGNDQLIRDQETFDLGAAGVERFATTPIEIEVFVNTRPHIVNRRVLDFWTVVRLEHPDADPANAQVEYTITYDKGPRQNPSGNLVNGQSVEIKGGMEFYVLLTDKS
ncbi:multiubiquitin domain-containing protein [Lysobacter hankyongensis]|uniref:Multiubiquitin domain-containing protein n=1 Tax=Lysobacter hankyongensis TaxID=1176535 RepID=A0ABP9BM56_9GAMM